MIFAGGAIALAGGVVVAALSWMQPSLLAVAPSAGAGATAEVTRGTLRDTKTVTGTLGYGELTALRPSLVADTAVVTWIAPVGSTVRRGEPLYRLDGLPTVLWYGSMPQHRTLRFELEKASPVWVELEKAQTAVETAELTLQLQEQRLADAEARGTDARTRLADALSSAPATSEFIELAGAVQAAEAKLGRVRELSAAALTPTVDVAIAEAELATARATLDAAIRVLRKDLSAAGLDAATAGVAVADARVKRDELRDTLDSLRARAPDTADVAELADNLTALGYTGTLAERVRSWQRAAGLPVTGIVDPSQVVIAAGPVHIASHSAGVGETLIVSSSDRGAIFDYSGIDKEVSVPLAVADHALAAVGRAVTITLPDDTKVAGTISEVGSVVTDGSIEITVAISDQVALGGLEVASVDVEFVSDSRADVLSVPVAALLARPQGGFAVELVTGGTSILVPVKTGLFASGRVEIAGEGIAEGMRVGVPG